ncbi:hypothetical protein D3C75_860140 [compost metagenome]
MPRLGHHDHPVNPQRLQHLGRKPGILPGRAAALLPPFHLDAEIFTQAISHQPRLARRRTIVQPATGQHRQARSLGQPRGKAHALQCRGRGLVTTTPGRVTPLTPRAQHHDGIRPACQAGPITDRQRRFRLQHTSGFLHHQRQAHQPQATKAHGKTQRCQPGPATTQPPRHKQQQEQDAWRHQPLFDEESDRHRPHLLGRRAA